MTKNNKNLPYNLRGWFSCRTGVLILAKKATNNLPKFPKQNFGQTQQQIFNLSKISIHKVQGHGVSFHGEIIYTN